MRTFLIILLILSGIIFIGSTLLMAPKGGIGMGIGGLSGNNEYGSKKSLEGKISKIATISGIVFLICSLLLPYSK